MVEFDYSTQRPVGAMRRDILDALLVSSTSAKGGRYVSFGDSITIAGDDYTNGASLNDSYASWFPLLSKGRVRLVRNAGKGGDTTQKLLDRFDTDVAPYNPSCVSLLAGTNDFTFGVTIDTFRKNIKLLVAKIRALGAVPILITSPPCNVFATPEKAKIIQANVWLTNFGASQNIPVVDIYNLLVDPATSGNYKTIYDNGDGIHPNGAGQYEIGKLIANMLDTFLSPVPTSLTPWPADTNNLLGTSGCFTADSNADGLADNWSINWTPAASTYTASIVTDSTVPGKLQRLALNGAADKFQIRNTVTTGFSAGDTVRLSALVSTTATVGGVGFSLAAVCVGTSKVYVTNLTRGQVTKAVVSIEFVVPTGTTSIGVEVAARNLGTATGNADFGQVTFYNLTTNDLVTI